MAAREAAPANPRETDSEREKAKDTTNAGASNGQNPGASAGAANLTDAAATIVGRLESSAAEKAESVVGGRGFATLLGWVTENVIAVTRIGGDIADLAVRNLRLAGRKDFNRLGVQQARTEDKLELLLQEVRRLEAELRRARESSGSNR